MNATTHALAELYGFYKNGFLLMAGGLQDQPAWYLQAMSVFDNAMNKEVMDRQERNRQDMKKQRMKR